MGREVMKVISGGCNLTQEQREVVLAVVKNSATSQEFKEYIYNLLNHKE